MLVYKRNYKYDKIQRLFIYLKIKLNENFHEYHLSVPMNIYLFEASVISKIMREINFRSLENDSTEYPCFPLRGYGGYQRRPYLFCTKPPPFAYVCKLPVDFMNNNESSKLPDLYEYSGRFSLCFHIKRISSSYRYIRFGSLVWST